MLFWRLLKQTILRKVSNKIWFIKILLDVNRSFPMIPSTVPIHLTFDSESISCTGEDRITDLEGVMQFEKSTHTLQIDVNCRQDIYSHCL